MKQPKFLIQRTSEEKLFKRYMLSEEKHFEEKTKGRESKKGCDFIQKWHTELSDNKIFEQGLGIKEKVQHVFVE
jgi:hypothetical protein